MNLPLRFLLLSATSWLAVLAPAAEPAGKAPALPSAEPYRRLWSDPALNERIARGIETHRKGDATLAVVDAQGRPVAHATVEVRLRRHAFLFGCNLFALDQLATPELNRRYEEAFARLFNFATVPFYWGDLEPVRGEPRFAVGSRPIWRRPPPDRLVAWCRERDITPKGHPLMYVKTMFMPAWTARADPEELRRQGAAHMAEIAARYGTAIPIWDVVNEEIPRRRHPGEWHAVPADYLPWCFREATRILPKDTQLMLNDGTHEAHDTIAEYEALLLELQRQPDVRLGGVGIQFHLYGFGGVLSGKTLPPAQLERVYERLGRLGLPLYITEITIPGGGAEGAAMQGEIVANLYRLWFATPAMAGITWWNLGDGTAFEQENNAGGGLLDKAMEPKPAFRALDRLINQEWTTAATLTTDARGHARFRGFHGQYTARVVATGRTQELRFELKRGAPAAPIALALP